MTPVSTLRAATGEDREALVEALVAAANWDPDRPALSRDAVLAEPALRHYVTGWGGPRDLGVVAVEEGVPVGAAWLRDLPADDPGYGFVADGVPEVSIGVRADWRGQGIGAALLQRLLADAAAAGIDRVSLSVERANPAQRLYRRAGFVTVATGRDSDTMLLVVAEGAPC